MIGLFGLLCLFLPNRMCSRKAFGAFGAFITVFGLFAFIPENQYTFNHQRLHVVILISLHTATKPTASSSTTIYCLKTVVQLHLHLQLLHTPTAVATICHEVYLKCYLPFWGFCFGSDQQRNRLNCTYSWCS